MHLRVANAKILRKTYHQTNLKGFSPLNLCPEGAHNVKLEKTIGTLPIGK
jgi:hypothetical protein